MDTNKKWIENEPICQGTGKTIHQSKSYTIILVDINLPDLPRIDAKTKMIQN